MDTFRKSAGWALIIRGLLLGLFGFLVLFMESKTIYGPMNFLGIVFLVSGSLYFILSILLRKSSSAWIFGLLWGLIDLLSGGYIMLNMEKATALFTDIIGIFAIFMGLSILASAFFIKGYRIFLYINSIVSLSFGFLILSNPTIGRLDFLVGLYALLMGMFVIYGGYRLLRYHKKDIIVPLNES